MAMKEYSKFHKAPGLDSLQKDVVPFHIQDSRCLEDLISLQRSNQKILQPQLMEQFNWKYRLLRISYGQF